MPSVHIAKDSRFANVFWRSARGLSFSSNRASKPRAGGADETGGHVSHGPTPKRSGDHPRFVAGHSCPRVARKMAVRRGHAPSREE